ncbi:MAG TPA: hypothetical protein PK208_12135 [Fibrobacteria bacterium]|nr:hypothetical protein [Fibrobacteria bacterium]
MSNSIGTTNEGASTVWNAPLRALHSALLLVGGTDMAREFWGGHPLELHDRVLTGVELHQHIWNEQAVCPLEYLVRVIDSVEAFCLYHEIDFLPFLEQKVFGIHSGTFLSPKGALFLIGRFLVQLTRSRDVRQTVLELVEPVGNLISPMTVERLVSVSEDGGTKTAWVLHIHDPSRRGRIPGYDAQSWLGMQLRHSPSRIDAPSMDEVDCLCEVRDLGEVLEAVPRGLHPLRIGGEWMLNGEVVARPTTFFAWLAEHGIRPDSLPEVPDHPVELAIKDIHCPVRRRLVVRSGSILGAKCYLLRARWVQKPFSEGVVESGLSRLIRDVMGEEGPSELDRASALHEQLLLQYKQRLQFVFHRQDETISCNGEHLLRGVPAKILQKVLMSHTVTGRTCFEHREFRRDPDLHLDPVNPNLESRIRILSDRLEERLEGIRIVKSGRGRFELETQLMVEFSEQ